MSRRKLHWVKQITRENTLFERSLRTVAYCRSISTVSQARMANVLILGERGVTSAYYLPDDYQRQKRIITREFTGSAVARMSDQLIGFMEKAYQWSRSRRGQRLTRPELLRYYYRFMQHYARVRGIVFYGFWGSPLVIERLGGMLRRVVPAGKVDVTLSILSTPHPVSGMLTRLRSLPAAPWAKRERLMKRLRLSRRTTELADILSWHTFYYEVAEHVCLYVYDAFMRQVRWTLSARDLRNLDWYDPRSFVNLLRGERLNPSDIAARKDMFIMEMVKGRWRLLVGQRARSHYQKYLREAVPADRSTLRGTVASPGRVRGPVKIVFTKSDQSKVKRGDILVSPMTTPPLMTAVRKAAAIVTDEGGMTAHAAIVSRELNIPCVVGTKIATQVFKDGDRVEVDAMKGVVKRL